jgi:hypothetical protein
MKNNNRNESDLEESTREKVFGSLALGCGSLVGSLTVGAAVGYGAREIMIKKNGQDSSLCHSEYDSEYEQTFAVCPDNVDYHSATTVDFCSFTCGVSAALIVPLLLTALYIKQGR